MSELAAALIGNLDCEVTWTGGPPLPAAVMARLARLATTLRALSPEGVADDEVALWLPAPVPAAAIAAGVGPQPRLVTGAWPRARSVLPWGACTGSDSGSDSGSDPGSGSDSGSDAGSGSWREALWAVKAVTVDVARAASDRRLAAALAGALGVALPGATTITSVDELRAHLAAGGAGASPTGAWVVKAVVTSAGRERVRRTGELVDQATATRIARLLARHGALVFEPWLDRLLDLGVGGVVEGAGRARLLPPHRPWCDDAGVVRGVVVDDGAGLEPAWRAELARVAGAVATRLGAVGYRGGYVVDALVHRTASGPRLHPLVEINPRLTFGLVARAWAERTGATILGLGGPPPPGARPHVLDDAGGWAAWLAEQLP